MTEDQKAWGQTFVANAIGDKRVKGKIVVHFGFTCSEKRWPGEDARRILMLACSRGYHCFLFDYFGIIDGEIPSGVTLAKNIKEHDGVIAIINACDIVLCSDGTIYNIGKRLKKHVIALFGFVPVMNKQTMRDSYVPNAEAVVASIENEWELQLFEDDTEQVSTLDEIKTFEI